MQLLCVLTYNTLDCNGATVSDLTQLLVFTQVNLSL